ncbi:MAG: DUF4430 domain-containing protein [archaeon]
MNRSLFAGLAIAAVLLGSAYMWNQNGSAICPNEYAVTININPGGGFMTSEGVNVGCGTTALEATGMVADLKTSEHEQFGVFVEGINGVEQDFAQGYYWQYYVDGELAPVGAGAYKIKDDVTIEWRLEKPPEEYS